MAIESIESTEQHALDALTEAWEAHYRGQMAMGVTTEQLRAGEGGSPSGEEYDAVEKVFTETAGDEASVEKIKTEILDRLETEGAAA